MAQKQQNQKTELLKEKFERLRVQWVSETMHMSNVHAMTNSPAYREIIEMGYDVVPLIIYDIEERETGFWYYALNELIGESPEIPKYAAGDIRLVNKLYIAWYYRVILPNRERLYEAIRKIESDRDKA